MSEPLKAILTFDEKAGVMFVYEDAEKVLGDEILTLLELGDFSTKRASHVEPSRVRKGMTELSAWTADMSPVGGPILGPFSFRYEALKAERDWLREERGV